MAKLFNTPTEAIALRSLCSRDRHVSGTLLSRLDSTYFHLEEAQEAFAHIATYFGKKGEAPAFKLVCEDLGLSEDAREFLRSAEAAAKNVDQASQLVNSLNTYRQTRIFYKLAKTLIRNLEDTKIDPGKLVELIGNALSKAQLRKAEDAVIVNIGRDSNIREILAEILYEEENDDCIPTGFKTFDSVNGGFFRGSLVTIGGNSGGGKSIVANQLNTNQASLGYKTTLVPLEMSAKEMVSRTASGVSGMSSIDIFLKRLASGEKDLVWKRMMRADKRIAAAGGRYSIFKPKEDLSIEELMAALHSLVSDVIYIDYISLLKGADGEDQWRKLGQIARFGKIYAESHNKVVVLLAQVNDEGKLRYSQAVKEHSSLSMVFVATKETKEKGYLNVELQKSRNQVDRPFTLRIEYAKMQVRDLEPEELQRLEGDRRTKKPGDKSRPAGKNASPTDGNSADYVPDLTDN